MVKRVLLYSLLAPIVFAGLLAAAAVWLLGTEAGARFAVAMVPRLTAAEVRVGELAGTLGADLRLNDLHLSWPDGSASVQELRLRWRPRQLLRRHLQVDELTLHGVQLQLPARAETEREESTPFDPGLPAPELIPGLSGAITELQLTDLTLQRPEEAPQKVREFSARVNWQRPQVQVTELRLILPQLQLAGEGSLDLAVPRLEVRLQGELTEPVAQIDEFSLNISLTATAGERRMAGPIALTASGEAPGKLVGQGTIDWGTVRLALESFRLHRPEMAGEVTGRLELTGGVEPAFQLRLGVKELDLYPWVDRHTELAADLEAAGTFDAYRGRLRLASAGESWQALRLDGAVTGSRRHFALTDLDGQWLAGQLTGALAANWQQELELQLQLQGEGLDPAQITLDWPGELNFSLSASAALPPDGIRAEVNGRLHDSRLRGHPLTGAIEASLQGEDLQIAELTLQGEGIDLFAAGRLRERIDFHARVARLEGLIPRARGSLQAEGWTRWHDRQLTGELQASGGELAFAAWRLQRFQAQGKVGAGGDGFNVEAEATGLVAGELRLARLTLDAEGVLEQHRLRLSATGPELELRLAAQGGYADQVWDGTLTTLAGREGRLGRWQLERPTALRLSRQALRIAPFYLVGSQGTRLQGGADLTFEPWQGEVEAHWERLDLSLANRWLEEMELDGESTGSAAVLWQTREQFDLSLQVDAQGGLLTEGKRIGLDRVAVQGSWNASGLQGKVDLSLTGGGTLTGAVSSEEPAAVALPASGQGELHWRGFDLSLLSPWLPELSVAGSSKGDLRGSWADGGEQVTLVGAVELAGQLQYRQTLLRIRRGALDLDWGSAGVQGSWELQLEEGGGMRGTLAASSPAGLAVPENGELTADWQRLDLALFSPLLTEGEVTGSSSGQLQGKWAQGGERLSLAGEVELTGRLVQGDLVVAVRRSRADLTWDAGGLAAHWNLALEGGGTVDGSLQSAEPARLAVPERGRVDARWQGIDLALMRPWMPEQMLLEGGLAGDLNGQWQPQGEFELSGKAALVGGELQWEGEGGMITAALRETELNWRWQEERLEGGLTVTLAEYGRAEGSFSLPLPARFPLTILPEGPVRGELTGTLKEDGLLMALLPGVVQESRGTLDIDLRLGGNWQQPDLGGEARLSEAGAYLPAAGIRLQEVAIQARLAGEEIRVESFRVRSGPGQLEGTAIIRLENWRLQGYSATVGGKRFRLVDLPELQMLVNPDLKVEGGRDRLSIQGEVLLPEVLVRGREQEAVISPSPDVVIVDDPAVVTAAADLPMAVDLRVRIVLGDHVLVKAEGVDARLEGAVRVTATSLQADDFTGQGEIRVAQGHYSTYGVRLRIERGTVLFAGGPIDRPTLDILALRTIQEVKAGVRVTGTPQQPELVLYSEPSMPDSEILAYMILGHPVGQGEGDVNLMMTAAGALLSKGESAVLQDRLKRLFGLDVLELEAGNGEVTGSQITIGKYLSPDLYISFGQALFANTNVVRLRYNLGKKWQLESSVGDESGVDLYYRIEFR